MPIKLETYRRKWREFFAQAVQKADEYMGKLERLGFEVKKTKDKTDEVVWVVKWKEHPITSLQLMLDEIDSNYMSRRIYPRVPAFLLTYDGAVEAFDSLPSRKDRALKLVDFRLSQFCNAVIMEAMRRELLEKLGFFTQISGRTLDIYLTKRDNYLSFDIFLDGEIIQIEVEVIWGGKWQRAFTLYYHLDQNPIQSVEGIVKGVVLEMSL
jgi:hypothetical protein